MRARDLILNLAETVAFCGVVVGVFMIGAAIDTEADAQLLRDRAEGYASAASASQQACQRQLALTARRAFQHGLDECADRERFERQQWLAAREGGR